MRIKSIELKNFKRFSDLRIEQIPESARLVLLIGANGSGKSSVFDAFQYISRVAKGQGKISDKQYYSKNGEDHLVSIKMYEHEESGEITEKTYQSAPFLKHFFGRSSLRIQPSIGSPRGGENILEQDADAPDRYNQMDIRFNQDVFEFVKELNSKLREPVLQGKQVDTIAIYREMIQPLNDSLKRVFGEELHASVQLESFEDNFNQPTNLLFSKGNQKRIPYSVLSHGEKQVLILLLNFIVRKKYYEDSILFIDEMDVHLNTRLQYTLLKEITEAWLPEGAQLWTATHALGFMEYANDAADACILDFDALDFDQSQVIFPSPKNNYQVFELAVSKEFIDKAFQGRTIYFSEQTDTPIYNDLGLENTFFFDGKDKHGCFYKAQNLGLNALVDRDYLLDSEVADLQGQYPFLRFTPYYSIENLLYHPDNLEEYAQTNQKPFDKEAYKEKLLAARNEAEVAILTGMARARDGYPFYKENGVETKLKAFKSGDRVSAVGSQLKSTEFEAFYKVFPMKDYAKDLPERQLGFKKELAKTSWFKAKIMEALQ